MAECIAQVSGRGCVLRGDEIDTDRIIPARYLRCVTFEGIGAHAFADDRAQLRAAGELHPLDQPRFAGAAILIVGENFGCGSSREHAPQSLMRAGFRAFAGAGFSEIFSGNCTALGLPCAVLDAESLAALMASVEQNPRQELRLDLAAGKLAYAGGALRAALRSGARKALLEGAWDAAAVLAEAQAAVAATAAALPYVSGFADAADAPPAAAAR